MAKKIKGILRIETGLELPSYTSTEIGNLTGMAEGFTVFNSESGRTETYSTISTVNGGVPQFHSVAVADEVADTVGGKLAIDGLDGGMTGPLVLTPAQQTASNHAATIGQLTAATGPDATKVSKAGDSMSGDLTMTGNEVTGLPATPSATGATSVEYVDGLAVNYATATQGTTADSAVQPGDSVSTLLDVAFPLAPTSNQVLQWNATNSAFEPATLGAGVTDLDGLSDVIITGTPATKEVLVSDGTDFVNRLLVKADVSDFAEGDYADATQGGLADTAVQPTDSVGVLADVTITTAADGDFLRHNGTALVNTPLVAADIPSLTASYATAAQGLTADSAVQPTDSVGTLVDVDLTGVVNDQILVWATDKFVVGTPAAGGADRVLKAGDTMTGNLLLPATPAIGAAATNVAFVTGLTAQRVVKTGDSMSGPLTMTGGNEVLGLPATPTGATAATSMAYVDGLAANYATAMQGTTADSALQNLTLTSIHTLSDVHTVAATDGQVLAWDNGNSRFAAVTPFSASDLSNYVTLDTVQTITAAKTIQVNDASFAISSPATYTPSVTLKADSLDPTSNEYYENLIDMTNNDIKLSTSYTYFDTNGATGDISETKLGQLETFEGGARLRGARYDPTTINPTNETLGAAISAATDVFMQTKTKTAGATTKGEFRLNTDKIAFRLNSTSGSEPQDFLMDDTLQKFEVSVGSALITYDGIVDSTTMAFGKKVTSPATIDADGGTTLTTKAYVLGKITAATGASAINDLTDVTITAAADGDFLRHNGSIWVDHVLVKADVSDFIETNYVHQTGDETIGGIKTFSTSVIVQGDLTVSGTTTTVDTANLAITDNLITLNNGDVGTAGGMTATTAGIEIDRGDTVNDHAQLLFVEATDKWQIGTVAAMEDIATEAYVDATSYVESFATGDWVTTGSPETFTVTAGTHGLDTTFKIYHVTVMEGTDIVDIETEINASGDVIIKTTGAVFAGMIRISL